MKDSGPFLKSRDPESGKPGTFHILSSSCLQYDPTPLIKTFVSTFPLYPPFLSVSASGRVKRSLAFLCAPTTTLHPNLESIFRNLVHLLQLRRPTKTYFKYNFVRSDQGSKPGQPRNKYVACPQ